MVSNQADTLARALDHGHGLHTKVLKDDDSEEDEGATWRQEDYAASSLPEKEQVQLRLAKAISFEQAALNECRKEIELVVHTKTLLKKMAPTAGHKLTPLHARDYSAQVSFQLWPSI
jgi:hypothetical protein